MSDSIYQRAVDVFGEEAQIGQLHEEMGELMQAINKHKRYQTDITRDNIIDEIVDMIIMCEQMKCMFDHDNKFEEIKKYKLWRLGETVARTDAAQYKSQHIGELIGYEEQDTQVGQ